MNQEIRLTYRSKRGAHMMRTVAPASVEAELKKLAKRGIEAYANVYSDGKRGECVGSSGWIPGQRGLHWWCDGDLSETQNAE